MNRRLLPWIAAVVVALAAYATAFSLIMRERRDISSFVLAGGPLVDPTQVPPGLSVVPNIAGYDGMAFYRLAVDPFTRVETAHGITLDNPAYRHQRILYPLLVHGLSLGNVEWIPTLLVVVNLLAVIALTLAGGFIAQRFGISPFAGVLLPLYPGFAIAFSRDTAEIVAAAFLASAIAAMMADRSRLASLLLCCAVLSRETAVVVPLAIGVGHVIERLRGRISRGAAGNVIAPLVVYGAWQAFLKFWWGFTALEVARPEPQIPFSGFARVLAAAAARRTAPQRVAFEECLLWALVVIAIVILWRGMAAAPQWRIAWIAFLGLASILPPDVWTEDISYMRVTGDLFVMSGVLLFSAKSRTHWWITAATAAVFFHAVQHLG